MKLRIFPPEGFSVADSYPHVRHVVRCRTSDTALSRSRHGYIRADGPVPDLVLLRFVLTRFGYRLS